MNSDNSFTNINKKAGNVVTSNLSASIMSAVTKVYLDDMHIPYIVTPDEHESFTDIYRVLLPLTKNVSTEVIIVNDITKVVTISVPEYGFDMKSPKNMRASEYRKLLHETMELIRFRCTGISSSTNSRIS